MTVDELSEAAVGPGSPPPSAPVTLQNYVRRLRQALGAGRDRIETQPGGYLIRVTAGELDMTAMEEALTGARRAARGRLRATGRTACRRSARTLARRAAVRRDPAPADRAGDTPAHRAAFAGARAADRGRAAARRDAELVAEARQLILRSRCESTCTHS